MRPSTPSLCCLLALALVALPPRVFAQTPPAAALPPAPRYDFNNPPQGVFDDEWMEVFLNGKKVGYMHQVFRRRGDVVFSEAREEYHIGREGSVMKVTADVTTEETVDGQPRAFHSDTRLADQPTIVDGHGEGLAFNITAQTGGFRDQRNVTFPAGTMLAWGQERVTRQKGLADGTAYRILAYDPSNDPFQPLPMQVSVGAREKINVHGAGVEAAKVNMHLASKDGSGGVDTVLWVDADNRVVKTTMPLGGVSMEALVASPEQALAAYLPADIFQGSLIVLDQPVPEGAASVIFDLRRTDGQPLPVPPKSATAHSEAMTDGGVRLMLTRLDADGGRKQALKDSAPYLARNSYLDTADPVLRSLAQQAAGATKLGPAERAARLRDFVTNYITKKDLSVGFATASEAARRREGDCTEHAVLLAALGRVLGLPARVVAGLAYMPEYDGRRAVLGFHMWTQFYLDGRWVDYDSALNDSRKPVYWRLGMVASDLDDIALSDFSLDLMSWMSGMKVSTESAAPAPMAEK